MTPDQSSTPSIQRRWFIYALIDPLDRRTYYIGRTVDVYKRLHEHILSPAYESEPKTQWIAGLIARGLTPEIRVLQSGRGHGYDEAEKRWIAAAKGAGEPLFNKTAGGDGVRTLTASAEVREHLREARRKRGPVSEETRAKMSASQRARGPRSAETREKLRIANLGKRHTAETKAKLSKIHTNPPAETRARMSEAGKQRPPMSEETKAKLSAANKGRPDPLSPETRQRVTNASIGLKRSEETIAKLKAARAKREPLSDEARAKMSAAQKLAWQKRKGKQQ